MNQPPASAEAVFARAIELPVGAARDKFVAAQCGGDPALGREVEMLVLNRASASVAASAIRGIPLVMNDLSLCLDFEEVVSHEAADFQEMMIRDFLEQEALCRRS